MRRRFVAIDLARLPPPDAVVPPDVEAIIAQRKQAVLDRIDDPDLRAEVEAVFRLESEPLVIQAEAAAYRELIHYQRVNEAVRGVLLPTARGSDLDNLCSRLGVERQVIVPAQGSVPALLEADDDLRYRYQLALEAFSTAGPYGAYEFHARSAHPLVKDVGVYGPESGLVAPGNVLIVVLSRVGSGAADADTVDAVAAALSDEHARPLTDNVTARSATIVPYEIAYHLHLRPGSDPSLVVEAARSGLEAYAADMHRVGRPVVESALDGAAHSDRVNVLRAIRVSPATEIDPGADGAAWCTGVTVTYEIVEG